MNEFQSPDKRDSEGMMVDTNTMYDNTKYNDTDSEDENDGANSDTDADTADDTLVDNEDEEIDITWMKQIDQDEINYN